MYSCIRPTFTRANYCACFVEEDASCIRLKFPTCLFFFLTLFFCVIIEQSYIITICNRLNARVFKRFSIVIVEVKLIYIRCITFGIVLFLVSYYFACFTYYCILYLEIVKLQEEDICFFLTDRMIFIFSYTCAWELNRVACYWEISKDFLFLFYFQTYDRGTFRFYILKIHFVLDTIIAVFIIK